MDEMIGKQAAIDIEGLDEQIRCEMCRNPMHTNRGCDGNCKYDEKLYEKIMQIFNERIKLLPSAQAEIIRCKDCRWYGFYSCKLHGNSWMRNGNGYCDRAERRIDDIR